MKIPFLKIPRIAKKYPIAFTVALILHIIFLIILLTYQSEVVWEAPKVKQTNITEYKSQALPKAVSVDFELIKQEKERIANIAHQKELRFQKRKKELQRIEKKQKIAQQKTEKALDKRKKTEKAVKLATKKRKKAEQATKKALKEKEKALTAKKKALNKRKKEEKAAKLATKKRQKAEQATKKALKEKQKALSDKEKAEQKRQKEELAIKEALIKKKAVLAAKKRIEVSKKAIEKARALSAKRFKQEKIRHELSRELAKEEEAENRELLDRQLKELKGDYIYLISTKVRKNWRASRIFQKEWACTVLVKQDLKGVVKTVNITACNNDSIDFKRSIKSAVRKASPLPIAPIDDIFDEILQFEFRPK